MKRDLFAFVAVVKTRLQTIKKGEGEKYYKGIADCLMLVYLVSCSVKLTYLHFTRVLISVQKLELFNIGYCRSDVLL